MHLTLRDSICPVALSVPLPRDLGSRPLTMAKPLVDVYTPGASRRLGAAPLVDRPQPLGEMCFLFVFSFPEYVFVFFLIRLIGYFSPSISRAVIFELAPGPTVVCEGSRLAASALVCGARLPCPSPFQGQVMFFPLKCRSRCPCFAVASGAEATPWCVPFSLRTPALSLGSLGRIRYQGLP